MLLSLKDIDISSDSERVTKNMLTAKVPDALQTSWVSHNHLVR